MTLFDYPVSFPFGATTAPYSPTHPHSGEDRAAPSGTPIVVSGVQLGVVGATGQVTGPHTHIQKAVNGVFVSPNGAGGNVTGKVTEVGYNTEIGNFVRIVDASGVRWSYFHMRDVPLVKVGQIIGGDDMYPNQGDIVNIWRKFLGKEPNANDIAYWTTGTGNPTWSKGASEVWKALFYNLSPPASTVSKQAVIDYVNQHLS